MHPLLARQLRRVLGPDAPADAGALPSPLRELAGLIDEAYQAADAERELSTRSMEMASQELFERNQQMAMRNEAMQEVERELRRSHEQLESRVAERTAELNEALQEAQAANLAKSRFLANMSHEIRTPMTAILGFADMLLTGSFTDEQRHRCLQTIRRQGEHLLSVLNDILDLSKIEAGKLSVEQIDCSPCAVVEEAISLMQVRAVEKGIGCGVEYRTLIPAAIRTDPTRLRQILLNLLGNAIKFTETGGVRLRVGVDQADTASASLRVDVSDIGIGMSERQMADLFQPFKQADDSMTRRFGGTGLGLSICKRLAQALGGDITVRSRPGEGSTFTLALAVGDLRGVAMLDARQAARAMVAAHADDRAAQPTTLAGRILVAEDGVHNQQVFRFYLEAAGADVVIVDNGRLAVEQALAAREAGRSYDLILMDMQMPEMDGYSAAALLRQRGYTGPIIAATAHAMSGDREKCVAAGCDDHITKPIDRQRLLKVAARYLSGSPAAAPPTPPPSSPTPPAAPRDDAQVVRCRLKDPDLADLAQEFVAELPNQVNHITDLLRDGDIEALRGVIHSLKGTGGTFGFQDITNLAMVAETTLRKTTDPAQAAAQVQALIDLIRRVEGFDGSRLKQSVWGSHAATPPRSRAGP